MFPKEAFICIWQAGGGIPPQISPVWNPAVERRFLELKGTVLFFVCGCLVNVQEVVLLRIITSIKLQLCANSGTMKDTTLAGGSVIRGKPGWTCAPSPPNEDKTNDAFKCSSVSQTFPGICPLMAEIGVNVNSECVSLGKFAVSWFYILQSELQCFRLTHWEEMTVCCIYVNIVYPELLFISEAYNIPQLLTQIISKCKCPVFI